MFYLLFCCCYCCFSERHYSHRPLSGPALRQGRVAIHTAPGRQGSHRGQESHGPLATGGLLTADHTHQSLPSTLSVIPAPPPPPPPPTPLPPQPGGRCAARLGVKQVHSVPGCVLPLREVVPRYSPPAFTVRCHPRPYRSLLLHNVISPTTILVFQLILRSLPATL